MGGCGCVCYRYTLRSSSSENPIWYCNRCFLWTTHLVILVSHQNLIFPDYCWGVKALPEICFFLFPFYNSLTHVHTHRRTHTQINIYIYIYIHWKQIIVIVWLKTSKHSLFMILWFFPYFHASFLESRFSR